MTRTFHSEDAVKNELKFFKAGLVENFSNKSFNFSRIEEIVVILIVKVVHSSEEPPYQFSESANIVFCSRRRRDCLDNNWP